MKITRRYILSIDAAKMRDVVYLLPPTDVADGRGGVSRTWPDANKIQCFAFVNPKGNDRSLQEAGLVSDNIIQLYIRYTADLQPDWKIRWQDDEYTIHATSDVDALRRFLNITAYVKQ